MFVVTVTVSGVVGVDVCGECHSEWGGECGCVWVTVTVSGVVGVCGDCHSEWGGGCG